MHRPPLRAGQGVSRCCRASFVRTMHRGRRAAAQRAERCAFWPSAPAVVAVLRDSSSNAWRWYCCSAWCGLSSRSAQVERKVAVVGGHFSRPRRRATGATASRRASQEATRVAASRQIEVRPGATAAARSAPPARSTSRMQRWPHDQRCRLPSRRRRRQRQRNCRRRRRCLRRCHCRRSLHRIQAAATAASSATRVNLATLMPRRSQSRSWSPRSTTRRRRCPNSPLRAA